MELKGITREWDSLKKDAAARAASAAPYVKEGKSLMPKMQSLYWRLLSNPVIRSTSRATPETGRFSGENTLPGRSW